MTDENYVKEQVSLVNTLTQAEFLIHGLYQAVGSIGFNANANITELMVLNHKDLTPL